MLTLVLQSQQCVFSSQPLVNEAFRASQQGITHRFVSNPQNNTLVHCRGVCGLAVWLSLVHIFVTQMLGWVRAQERMTVYDWTHSEHWSSVWTMGLAYPQFISPACQIPSSIIDENKRNLSLVPSPGGCYHFATPLCLTVVPQTHFYVFKKRNNVERQKGKETRKPIKEVMSGCWSALLCLVRYALCA